MFKETTLTDNNDGLNDILNRVHYLEEQVNILNMKIFPDEGLPGFEFYVEADGEDIWSGLDLKTNFPKILQKYPNNEIVINWRSLPVTILYTWIFRARSFKWDGFNWSHWKYQPS